MKMDVSSKVCKTSYVLSPILCKVLASLIMIAIVFFLEICSVQRWENGSLRKTSMYQTENKVGYLNIERFITYHENSIASMPSRSSAVLRFLQLENELKRHLQKATDKKVWHVCLVAL